MFATLELPIRDDGRNKRLQGGRACQPCRMKKIKCDGKQPCMQCKARHRQCNFLKMSDESYIRLDISADAQRMETDIVTPPDVLFPPSQTTSSPPNDTAQPPSRTDKMVEQLTDGLMRLSLRQESPKTNSSVTPWVDYGDLVRWSPEPSPPNTYSTTIEMPSRQTQEHLIEIFFDHCTLLPTFSRHMFHDQVQTQGTLITPLLLNVMYAHAAQNDASHQTNSSVYIGRASRLLDDFMDVSRLSTVIALLYMALYNDGSRSSRAWMYSGMAVRMCLDLGLHTSNYSSQMSQFDIELRRRVLWSCFAIDKLKSNLLERPCAMLLTDISLELPTALPEDSDSERHILRGFSNLCRLLVLMEKVVQFFSRSSKPRSSEWTLDDEKRTTQFLEDIKQWQSMLPEDMRMPSSLALQSATPVVINLHLLCYSLELSLMLCLRYQNVRAQQRMLAHSIIQLVSVTAQDYRMLYSSALTAFSGLLAALTLINDFSAEDSKIASNAIILFRQCLEDVRTVLLISPIRDMQDFMRLLDLIPQSKPLPAAMESLTVRDTAASYGHPSPFSSTVGNLGCDNDSGTGQSPALFMQTEASRRRYPTAPAGQYAFDPSYMQSNTSTILPPIASSSSSTGTSSSKNIEPADYTFELISIADEWARALNNFSSTS